MVYKVLIADDEAIIREELAKAFDWSQYGMELVGLARNGQEALAMAQTLKPNICLLDINMPHINGLDLIKRINKMDDTVVHVIISGYDEFEYAREAVRLGVFEFVLKPIDEDSFIAILKNIRNKLDSQAETRRYQSISASLLDENKKVLRNDFFTGWLSGSKSQQEIEQGLEYFQIRLPDLLGIVLIRVQKNLVLNETKKQQEIMPYRQVIETAAADTLSPEEHFVIELDESHFLLMMSAQDQVRWNKVERDLDRRIDQSGGFQIRVAKRLCNKELRSVAESYSLLDRRMKNQLTYLPLVVKAMEHVEKHYEDSQLRLQHIADDNQVSISYLSRLFKQETKTSFIDYLIQFRIEKSLELLDRSSLRISTISEMVGYSSQHYYCEAFKKVMGISPTEYRKRNSFSGRIEHGT